MSADGQDSRVDFSHEISCMMYSFGDVKNPSQESVVLLEDIVHTQVAEIVLKAADVTQVRGGKSMSVDDTLFLLRKNKDKLKFVLRQLHLKDIIKGTKSNEAQDSDYLDPPPVKKRKYSLSFLNEDNQIMVGSRELDNPLMQRLERMDEITKDMNEDQYIHYTRCRQANFHKNMTKFTKWLNLSSLTKIKIGQELVEIFGFLAYMTAQDIVELSLLVKEDIENASLRPHLLNHSCHPQPLFGTTPTFSTLPANPEFDTLQPQTTPPSSPVPSAISLCGHDRNQRASLALTAPLDRAMAPLESGAIQPRHIHEAMRRFSYVMGPLIPLSTHFPKTTFYKRLLCT